MKLNSFIIELRMKVLLFLAVAPEGNPLQNQNYEQLNFLYISILKKS